MTTDEPVGRGKGSGAEVELVERFFSSRCPSQTRGGGDFHHEETFAP